MIYHIIKNLHVLVNAGAYLDIERTIIELSFYPGKPRFIIDPVSVMTSILRQTFYDRFYDWFVKKALEAVHQDKLSGTIIDIGAFIGDTAEYFALKGANEVVAYEPVSRLYNLLIRNIQYK